MSRREWIENPKLLHHPEWLEKWREDPFSVPPIYVEISPSGRCNHRCTFCAPELLGYPDNFLDPDILGRRFQEMCQIRDETGGVGFKSVQLAGEGEPGLHRDLTQIVRLAREAGMDVGILTNGTFLTYERSLEITSLVNGYLQVSVNAGRAETYAKIHRAPIRHWSIVWRHIEGMVKAKRELDSKCDIGVNMTLLMKEALEDDGRVIPSNWQEAELLVRMAKNSGVDYVSLKPYSQDAYSKKTAQLYRNVEYGPRMEEIQALSQHLISTYSSSSFEVVFRVSRFEEYEREDRGYSTCLAVPTVWSYIQSDGSWLSCSCHWTNGAFTIGNIYTQTVEEIWFGALRREHMRFVLNELDVHSRCRKGCHPDKENKYLTKLRLMPDERFGQEMARLRTLPRPKNANFI